MIFPSSGTGAWEAGIVNTLSPGDKVLMFETGQFARLWKEMAVKLGLDVHFVASDWRHGADQDEVEGDSPRGSQSSDQGRLVVHNETSSAVTNSVPSMRKAMDRAKHPALSDGGHHFFAGFDRLPARRMGRGRDHRGLAEGTDVAAGVGLQRRSDKALAASKSARMPKSYWDWQPMLAQNRTASFPYTPATNLLYGLRESLQMLHEEGLENVFERHTRHGEATRLAVRTWGLETVCADPRTL